MTDCERVIEWAGGKHVFDLSSPKVLAVLRGYGAQRKARVRSGLLDLDKLTGQNGDTPAACLKRFQDQIYSVEDVERVLLYGLWGGGMSLAEADEILTKHVRGKPIAPSAIMAFEILGALFVGAQQ